MTVYTTIDNNENALSKLDNQRKLQLQLQLEHFIASFFLNYDHNFDCTFLSWDLAHTVHSYPHVRIFSHPVLRLLLPYILTL